MFSALQQLVGRNPRRLGRHVHRSHFGRDPRPDRRSRPVQGHPFRGRQGVPVNHQPHSRGRKLRQTIQRARSYS